MHICVYTCVCKYIKQCLQVTCSNEKLSQKYGHVNVKLTEEEESYSVLLPLPIEMSGVAYLDLFILHIHVLNVTQEE